MPRSLKVNREALERVKISLLRNGFPSQRALALDIGIALSTVSRFFTGKPVDYSTFVDLCEKLNLEWKDIADLDLARASSQKIQPVRATLKLAIEPKSNHTQDKNSLSALEDLPFPEGAVAPNSPFYQSRNNIESICCETVIKPASLIRIKAPTLMGKTSLMMRILAYAQSQNYRTVYLDLANVETSIIADLDKFLRWLSFLVGKQLGLANQLDDYWDLAILGSNGNCTAYFEEYLLPNINCPVVLALDEVDRLFPYDIVVEDFLGMLRSWHEKGKIDPIWQNLRLIMAHSTEVYISLDLNQSPFNAGVPIELREFDTKQIAELAKLHQLNWSTTEIVELMNVLGGHPYLIRLAMYYISDNRLDLATLLNNASQEISIYSNHLRQHLELLQQKSSLAASFKQVVLSNRSVELNPKEIYQLYSMGLIELEENRVVPRCKLYRDYFARVL